MKLGAHIYLWTERWSDAETGLFDRARGLGLDMIELSVGLDVKFSTAQTRRAAEAAGVGLLVGPGGEWPAGADLSDDDPANRRAAGCCPGRRSLPRSKRRKRNMSVSRATTPGWAISAGGAECFRMSALTVMPLSARRWRSCGGSCRAGSPNPAWLVAGCAFARNVACKHATQRRDSAIPPYINPGHPSPENPRPARRACDVSFPG